MENVMPDIPRYYSAIAEWMSCMLFVVLLKHRFSGRRTVLLAAGALALQVAFMVLTGDVPIYLWIPCMIFAVVLMILYIYLLCDIHKLDAAYFGIQAFVCAEFMAALFWQLFCFLWCGQVPVSVPPVLEWLLMVVVYGGTCTILWALLHKHVPSDGRMHIRSREYMSALIIGVAIFFISNISFLSIQTPFSSQYSFEIMNIRTLVTLGGVGMLYAHMVQCCEIRVRKELEAVHNVLQNQYLQYRQSKESIDLINYKYHDLKHQIEVLRSEQDPGKREAFLNQMEEEIRKYEVQNKTGNQILDTVLTSKSLLCAKNDITFTCVADGTLVDFMDTTDICSIFGNALDNAIECEKQIPDKEKRLIHVTVSRQRDFLMIKVENYFEGKLKYGEGTPVTTKKDKKVHGYGIKSMRYTAEKYEGALSIHAEDNWFELKVLIPLPREKAQAAEGTA